MEVARIRGATHDFGKPVGWDEERDGKCGSLPVRVEPHGPELLACKSAWRPTSHELAILNAGGFVILSCVGGQPPVMLTVEPDEERLSPSEAALRMFPDLADGERS